MDGDAHKSMDSLVPTENTNVGMKHMSYASEFSNSVGLDKNVSNLVFSHEIWKILLVVTLNP